MPVQTNPVSDSFVAKPHFRVVENHDARGACATQQISTRDTKGKMSTVWINGVSCITAAVVLHNAYEAKHENAIAESKEYFRRN